MFTLFYDARQDALSRNLLYFLEAEVDKTLCVIQMHMHMLSDDLPTGVC